jgi:hypothetical protein
VYILRKEFVWLLSLVAAGLLALNWTLILQNKTLKQNTSAVAITMESGQALAG